MSSRELPKILAFLCHWCGYSCADLAGTSRIHYPASIRAVEVMCSCMVHPEWVVKALMSGIDGVMIFGCHLGECHYGTGNQKAEKRAEIIQQTLEDMGIEPERFSINWVSAAEAHRFSELVSLMTEGLKELGPNMPALPFKRDEEAKMEAPRPAKVPFIHVAGGKKYYWDGRIYKKNRTAQEALARYLNMNLEAKLVPDKSGLLIYTRRSAEAEK